jgi:glycosyltransferase involved in cell wall biosynthesis
MPEHVGDGGILVPPQDEDALVEAIATVLSDVDLQKKLARQGRRQAAKFTWKRTARETLGVYQRVLAQV